MIIEQDGVKRELNTKVPFNLCLSRDEARLLRHRLEQAADDSWTHGWLTVWPLQLNAPAGTRALAWTDAGNVNPASDLVRR